MVCRCFPAEGSAYETNGEKTVTTTTQTGVVHLDFIMPSSELFAQAPFGICL